MKIINSLVIASFALTVVSAFAQDTSAPADSPEASQKREAVVQQREQHQQKRIEEGVKSGKLSAEEAAKLEKREARIKGAEEKAMADGKMTKGEFRKIERMQNKASRRIHGKKNN